MSFSSRQRQSSGGQTNSPRVRSRSTSSTRVMATSLITQAYSRASRGRVSRSCAVATGADQPPAPRLVATGAGAEVDHLDSVAEGQLDQPRDPRVAGTGGRVAGAYAVVRSDTRRTVAAIRYSQ